MRGSQSTKEEKALKGTGNQTRERRRGELSFKMGLASYNHETGAVTIPVAPDDLSPEAKAIWDRTGYQLASVEIFADSVYEYLYFYCQNYDVARAAWKEYGGITTIMNDKGEVKVNPAWKVYKEAVSQMIVIGAKLGFSPVDKTKINAQIVQGSIKDKNSVKKIGVNG